jgi:hypothetical protein
MTTSAVQQTTVEKLEGKAEFASLIREYPLPLSQSRGVRSILRMLPNIARFLKKHQGPCAIFDVVEHGNTVELGYLADGNAVEYYLGFLEALLEYFGERAFILVQAMSKEIRFKLTFTLA